MKKIIKFTKNYWRFVVTVFVGFFALIFAFISGDLENNFSHWLIAIWTIFIGILLFANMLKTLRSGKYGVDILAITAIIACLAVGQFWAALIIALMLTGGETLEDFAAHRARRELSELLKRAPQTAHLIKENKIIEVGIEKVSINDVVLIKPHEIVPVDGILMDEIAEFDESSLTGESLPVEKKADDKIMSGSLNGSEAVKIRASATAENSQYEQIIKLVRDAENQPAPFVRLADKYAVPFTIISYLIAGLAWSLSGEPARFAEVLVVASPCPLILAAPIALISGMSRASRHGIIVKSGATLEKMSAANVFAFDKTGTLTHGDVVVSEIISTSKLSESEILSLSASAEINSSHVLATSLVKYARQQKTKIQSAKNVREIVGDGIFATINKRKIIIGRSEFLKKNKIKNFDNYDESQSSTAIYLAVDNELAGVIYFADELRKESKNTLKKLRNFGVKNIIMLTGDRRKIAEKIANSVGADRFYAELLPADKVKIVRRFARDKNDVVAFVGDGINDAPVLAAADIGIAMGARGNTAASESADAVIMLDDLSRVSLFKQIAQRSIKVALQSVWSGITLCLILMIIAAFGFIPALLGAALQEVIDVVVIFNALRAHSDKI